MKRGASRRDSAGIAWFVATALILSAPAAGAGVTWLPSTFPRPTLIADPYEPRMAIAYFPADEHIHTSLGGIFPMAAFRCDSLEVAVSLDGGAWLELKVEDNIFPMETVDGAFGLRVDAAKNIFRAVVRITHWSAHRADGDSTVSYPPRAVSREYGTIEAGLHPGPFYGFARVGAAWHRIPESSGAMVGAGLQWMGVSGTWRPVLGAHYDYDPARGNSPTWTVFAGAETGGRPLRLGLTWWKGPGPGGQHFEQSVNRFGIEMQLAPLSH